MKMQSMAGFKRGAQAGFTLIELVVVIVILGILAATALPKFADLGADARLAKIQAARAAVMTATSTVHATWLMRGSPSAASTQTMEGATINVNTAGYPVGTDIASAAGDLTDYSVTAVTAAGATVGTDTGHTSCVFTYTAATGAVGAAPVLGNC